MLKSTVHRVFCSVDDAYKDRYSIAYFCHPANDTKLVPVPSAMVKGARAEGLMNGDQQDTKELTAEEHLKRRLASTYGWKS